MSETALTNVNEKETVKKLKRELEGWREIVLILNSVLVWEKNWHPGFLIGFSSFIFSVFWLAQPSLLSSISGVALLLTLLDYLVPTLSASLFNADNWSGAKEKQFEEICKTLAHIYTVTYQQTFAFLHLKYTSPKLYYAVTLFCLSMLAYIGNKINNLVLTYIILTHLLLVPGLLVHGYLQKYYQMFLRTVAGSLKSLNGTGDKPKTN